MENDNIIAFPGNKQEIKISVRTLVEFILRHGDIDNRHQGSPDNAMQEGSRIHRMIQKRMGSDYEAEVPLRLSFDEEKYILAVEGRADGIFMRDGGVTIDEIKGTYRELYKIKEPMPLHIAQAKCYAYMYAVEQKLTAVSVQITYCHIPTEEVKYFVEEYTYPELKKWFTELKNAYKKWADYQWAWKRRRQESIRELKFPFPYREGQKELAAGVYRTIFHGRKLFLEAPTGVGKTISTVFPAVSAMGQGMGDKLFYLTAKTITRTVADETFELLRERGLHFKSVILTAKEKICFMEEVECNPEYCPYAKGHFDRINDAIFDLLTAEDSFSREKVEEYALKHQVCPFEMCLDLSLFADGIICDYNYLFDPHVYLKRFFQEGVKGDYLFLIDEAHNLLERGREMYSAVLFKEQFMEMRREIKMTIVSETTSHSEKDRISGQISLELAENLTDLSQKEEDEAEYFEEPSREEDGKKRRRKGGKSIFVKEGYADKLLYQLDRCNKELLKLKRECETNCILYEIDDFITPLTRLDNILEEYLNEQEQTPPDIREVLLDFYFEVGHFLTIYELLDENYIKYCSLCEDGSFMVKLFCVNPADNLRACMDKGRSTTLFSATFLPIQYYKSLLGGTEQDFEIYARSVFNPEKRALLIADDVTSRYTRRGEDEYNRIADYIEQIVRNRHGNYMVFCPSYAFMRSIYEHYTARYAGEERECILQSEAMKEADREEFLNRFRENRSEGNDLFGSINMEVEEMDTVLIGFCVLGGIFSEGIDLKNDSLIGAIIVGTGLPQVCFERELLKDYFDSESDSGFDYAYRYPGMNKVLQAAGRVIRTAEDVGVIALLDDRFNQYSYRKMFPREWDNNQRVTIDTVSSRVERFWNEWL